MFAIIIGAQGRNSRGGPIAQLKTCRAKNGTIHLPWAPMAIIILLSSSTMKFDVFNLTIEKSERK